MPKSLWKYFSDDPEEIPVEEVERIEERFREHQERMRARILDDTLDSVEAARDLGISLCALRQRIRRGTLIGVNHQKRLRIPAWQIENGELLTGLKEVLRELRKKPDDGSSRRILKDWGLANWFLSSQPGLENGTPLHQLREGQVEMVVGFASHIGYPP